MARRIARETIMQIFYQMDMKGIFEKEIAEELIQGIGDKEYVYDMMEHFINNKNNIDDIINKNLKKWTIDRIGKIDLAILRLAITEMLYRKDIPVKVSINEAIELGKKYGTDDSHEFINGVLGAIANKRELL